MSWVLFFDGDCAFCSGSARFVARHDRHERVSFAPLQGDLARKCGFSHHAAEHGGMMVLLHEPDGRVFTGSDAAIRLAGVLGGGWRVLGIARCIPRCLREGIYRWIAENRFRWFGRPDACEWPDEALRKRLRN